MKILSFAGTFFLTSDRLSISHNSATEGGTIAVVTKESMSHAFSGHCHMQEEDGFFEGVMIDAYGPSQFDGVFSDNKLFFTKRYLRTGNCVNYSYEKSDGNTFIGTYIGDMVPEGITRCIVTKLDEALFRLDPA